jgi:PAS domain S-box-containing protein
MIKKLLSESVVFGIIFAILMSTVFMWFEGDEQKERSMQLQTLLSDISSDVHKQKIFLKDIYFHNNLDTIAHTSNEIQQNLDQFSYLAKKSNIHVEDFIGIIETNEEIIEREKSYSSAIKNSIAYLSNRANYDDINSSLVEDVDSILIAYYSQNLHRLYKKIDYDQKFLSKYVDIFHTDEAEKFKSKNALKIKVELLKAHINKLIEYYLKLHKLQDERDALNIDKAFDSENIMLKDMIFNQDKKNKFLFFLITISATIFLIGGFLLYYKNLKSLHKVQSLSNDLQQFVDALNESAIVSKSDLSGKITFVNDKFCKISGYEREELIGKQHNIIRHPDTPSKTFKELWAKIQNKEIFRAIIKNRSKNGDDYYVESVIIPLLDTKHEVKEYLSVRYDVTDIIRAKNEVIEAQIMKDEFMSNTSHELRTPLNAINGFSQILYKKVDEQNRRYVQMVLDNTNHLLKLINDILDLSKINSGKFEIHMYEFNLHKEYSSLLERISIQAEQKSVTLEYEKCEDDIYLLGDWLRVSQIIINLVSNAIKFSNKQSKIELGLKYADETLCIKIQDFGIGMSQEVQDKIFQPFVQADSSTTRKYGGTGLGLSIVSQLIELMSGRLELVSKENIGTTFKVYIPMKRVA